MVLFHSVKRAVMLYIKRKMHVKYDLALKQFVEKKMYVYLVKSGLHITTKNKS